MHYIEFLGLAAAFIARFAPALLIGAAVSALLALLFGSPSGKAYAPRRSGRIAAAFLRAVPDPALGRDAAESARRLREGGASADAAAAYFVSKAQSAPDSVAAAVTVLGPLPTAIRWLCALLSSALLGYVMTPPNGLRALKRNDPAAYAAAKAQMRAERDEIRAAARAERGRNRAARALNAAERGLLRALPGLIVACLIAAAVAVMLPDAFFTDMAFSGRLVTLFIILALGFLLGASGLSVAPLALALLMRGLDPGAVFLLLCAAPVFNMTELFNLGRVLGRAKSIIFMFASCVPSFVAAKIMQDLYMGKLWSFTFDELSAKPMENGFFLPGIVIFGLLCLGALVFLLRRDRKEKPLDLPADAVRLYLSGSWSEETESRLCDALAEVEGVSVASVYAARGLVLIRGPVDFAALSAACESVGLTLERTEQ